jgi:hypothetical protein
LQIYYAEKPNDGSERFLTGEELSVVAAVNVSAIFYENTYRRKIGLPSFTSGLLDALRFSTKMKFVIRGPLVCGPD